MKRHPAHRTEYGEQAAVFHWAARNEIVHPELRYLFATLNGVRLPVGLAAKTSRMGMRRGVPDIWLPVPSNGHHGLVIELKIPGNRATKEQKDWLDQLKFSGYRALVCYGADEAIETIREYLGEKKSKEVS